MKNKVSFNLKNIGKILFFLCLWLFLSVYPEINIDDPAWWRFFAELIPFVAIIILTIIFTRIEKVSFLNRFTKNVRKSLGTGIVLGLIWIILPSLILFSSKNLHVLGKNQVENLSLWIISAVINVIMQEILIRGYIYELLKINYSKNLAILATTILFTLLHGAAIEAGFVAIINVITMNLFINCLYEYEDNLIGPILAHTIWNVIGAIFLNVVSLASDYPSLINVKAYGSVLISGGAYKIEASILVTILNIAFMLYFYSKNKRKLD